MSQLKRLKLGAPNIFASALRKEAEIENKECVKSCPVDTGALRRSIHVEGPFREGRRIWCKIVAGGPTIEYALVVHEDLEAFHKVGGPKYIERPLKASAPYMAERIARRIDLNQAL